jgi:hypothetical protein
MIGRKNKNMTNVPLTKKSFYSEADISGMLALLDSNKSTIGNFIIKSAELVGLEPSVLAALIFVESPRNEDSGIYVGYCQIDISSAVAAIFYEFKKGRMSAEEEAYLSSLITPQVVARIKKAKADTEVITALTYKELKRPDVNIFIGAMFFKQCLDKEHIAGQLPRYDKAVLRYNSGFYVTIPPSIGTDTLLAVSPMVWRTANPRVKFLTDSKIKIMRDYVVKMFGSISPLLYTMKIYKNGLLNK